MALVNQFARRLEDLWRRRTAELRALVVPRDSGQPLQFTRKRRDRLIDQAQEIATEVLLKREGRRELDRVVEGKRMWKMKGHGTLDRGERMVAWARQHFRGPIVYAFWRGGMCLYVGKGGGGWKRIRSYARSIYIREANWLEVFQIRGESQLPKAECLLTHLYEPRDNKVKAAEVRWGKACPICRKHDRIRAELKAIFKMK